MDRNSALPKVTAPAATAEAASLPEPSPAGVEPVPEAVATPPETVIVQGEPVPESVYDVALLGTPSLVTLKANTEGPTMKVRIIRACNEWTEGDEPTVNADYGRQLIANRLAEEVKASKPAPTGKVAAQ